MIRTNLSTRPFYNEAAVRFWILVLAALVALVTIVNLGRLVRLSQSDTNLATQASQEEAEAAQLRAEAARLRATVDVQQIQLASEEARQANELIDRRTFSWTDLFNRFETTFPDAVRVTAVRPRVDAQRGMLLTINVVARSVEAVDELMRNLEATGAFTNVLSVEERVGEDGMLAATLESTYRPTAAPPQAPADAGAKTP
jgi:Tfp pilus assembly protein PilN